MVLIICNHVNSLGGIQEFNRRFLDAISAIFPANKFMILATRDVLEDRHKRWPNIELAHSGHLRVSIAMQISAILQTFLITITKRPRFIICSHVNISPLPMVINRLFGVKYAVLTHGTEVWRIKKGSLKYHGLISSNIIMAVSRFTKTKLMDLGIPENRIRIINNTVDSKIFKPRPQKAELIDKLGAAGKKVLLTVSRLDLSEKLKGHETMLQVMQRLDDDYIWVIVGDGDMRTHLENMADKIGIRNRIRFVGVVPDERLPDYYGIAKAFVMPSKKEGFGIVFLEAMASGIPVVAGNKDGSVEPLMGGRLGFLVDPDNVEEIASAVKMACNAHEDRTNPEFLSRETERYFGINAFRKKVHDIFVNFITHEFISN